MSACLQNSKQFHQGVDKQASNEVVEAKGKCRSSTELASKLPQNPNSSHPYSSSTLGPILINGIIVARQQRDLATETLPARLRAAVDTSECREQPNHPEAFRLYFQHRWPDVLWRVSTSSKIIALTIHDGPSECTDEIRKILKVNNATATFFIIGSQVAGYEKTLQDLIREGNELGNHGGSSRFHTAHKQMSQDMEHHSMLCSSSVIPPPTLILTKQC